MTAWRLLLIDDDEDMFVIVRDFLGESAPDWAVEWASTYEAGIAGLTTGNYDAALLDYHLGAHTGVELLESARTIHRLPPTVLLTGQGDRAIDLAAMATGASDYLDKGSLSPILLERTVRHAIERERYMAALRAGEAEYRGLFERAGDAVLIADDTGRYVDANPAACVLLGVTRDEAIGRSLTDFVDPSVEMPEPEAAWAMFLAVGEMRGQVKLRRPDGTIRDADFVATANVTPGRHLSVLRDDTDRLAAQTALIHAVAALSLSEARFRTALDGVALHALILDLEGRILFANRNLCDRTGWANSELIGSNVFNWLTPENEPTASAEAYEEGMTTGAFVEHVESIWRTRPGGQVRIAWTNSAIRDDTGRIVAIATVGEDVTARREAEATQARLVVAIGQAAESIIVMDKGGRAIYANPAFEQVSGSTVAEVVGRELAKVFQRTGAAIAYPRIGRTLKSGRPWSGEFLLTRPNGSRYREEVTISPVRDPSGDIVNYVRVGRDVTRLREIETSLESANRDRVAFANALARLQQRDTPEETARDIANALLAIPGTQLAGLLSFEETGEARVLAVTAPEGHPFRVGRTIAPGPAAHTRLRAAQGAWSERRDQAEADGQDMAVWDALGLRAIAYAPIGTGGDVIGVVLLGTTDERAALRIEDQLPAAIEFAAAANGLIAGPLMTRRVVAASRRRIEGIIENRAFEPVFQPIVNLSTGEPIGFEALTRFTDGTRPDHVFAEAGTTGMGIDLEEATLNRAILASRGLPMGAWLSLNVSPAMILESPRLSGILERRTRPIVLEVTEHEAIADYAAVHAAIALLGPDVRVAVDDSGAGVANFTHIVSLRPDFVKVDVGLVRGVNRDLSRQALIVGLRHFARATNGWLICEGVETEEERQTLIGLGLEFGQGYLFGRPAAVHTWSRAIPQPGAANRRTPRTRPASGGAARVSRVVRGANPSDSHDRTTRALEARLT